jgi:hypothetical protein
VRHVVILGSVDGNTLQGVGTGSADYCAVLRASGCFSTQHSLLALRAAAGNIRKEAIGGCKEGHCWHNIWAGTLCIGLELLRGRSLT